jgi:hypothetical protein
MRLNTERDSVLHLNDSIRARCAIVTVTVSNRFTGFVETSEALLDQTLPCSQYIISIGKPSSPATPTNAIRIDLPLNENQLLLARGIGLQLAFNEGADIVGCIEPGEVAEPQCLEIIATELERTAADILELRHPDRSESELGTLFYRKSAAFMPGLWTQILSVDEMFFPQILRQLTSLHGLRRCLLISPLIAKIKSRSAKTKTVPFRVPLADEKFARRLYRRTGILFGRVQRTGASKVRNVAVITPYYKEPLSMLHRCHDSVIRQGPGVSHFMVADGFPRPEVDQWKATHIKLPSAHGDNGNTPRGIGGIIAFAQGFDAVAYLDADNWFGDEHIKSLLQAQHQTGASVVCSWRIVVLPDGTILEHLDPEDEKKTHVDTSCYLITQEVAFLSALWAQMPQKLGPICDRVFLGRASEADPNMCWTHKKTVYFESNYLLHYKMANKLPDRPVHDIPPDLWRKLNPIEFRERTGKTIKLVKGQSAFNRQKKWTA